MVTVSLCKSNRTGSIAGRVFELSGPDHNYASAIAFGAEILFPPLSDTDLPIYSLAELLNSFLEWGEAGGSGWTFFEVFGGGWVIAAWEAPFDEITPPVEG